MNERIQKIAEKTDAWCKEYYFGQDPNNIDWEKKFAELIVQECINCYSPDDSATDWADKMRRMIEP